MTNKKLSVPHIYAANPLNRGERERHDEEWLKARAKDPKSKFLPMWELNVPITDGSQSDLGWITIGDMDRLGIDATPIFLGLRGDEACFAIDISRSERAVQEIKDAAIFRFENARTATEYLSGPDSGIIAQARSQINWRTVAQTKSRCS